MIRLPQRETKLMVAVHGWSGVVLGLLLYAVIVTGTAAVFSQEIKLWSAGALSPADPFARPVESLIRRLAADVPEEYRDDLFIRRLGTGNLAFFFHRHVKVDGQVREKGVLYEVAADDRIVARREGFGLDVFAADTASALGRFFVELHVRLHLPDPWGLILTGILGVAMLAAAVSGLLMHRHLIRDLFTLRPGAERLVSRRDLHTVAGTGSCRMHSCWRSQARSSVRHLHRHSRPGQDRVQRRSDRDDRDVDRASKDTHPRPQAAQASIRS